MRRVETHCLLSNFALDLAWVAAPQRRGGPHPGVCIGPPHPHGGLARLSQGARRQSFQDRGRQRGQAGGEVINKAGSREEAKGHRAGQALRHLWDLDVLTQGQDIKADTLISRERATRVACEVGSHAPHPLAGCRPAAALSPGTASEWSQVTHTKSHVLALPVLGRGLGFGPFSGHLGTEVGLALWRKFWFSSWTNRNCGWCFL